MHLAPIFTRRLALMPLDLGHPVWVEAGKVDLDYHIQGARLPKPGSERQLEALVAKLHAQPLDRERPLWQFTVIEGLADGQVALYRKVHHAALDGAGRRRAGAGDPRPRAGAARGPAAARGASRARAAGAGDAG